MLYWWRVQITSQFYRDMNLHGLALVLLCSVRESVLVFGVFVDAKRDQILETETKILAYMLRPIQALFLPSKNNIQILVLRPRQTTILVPRVVWSRD